MASNWERGGSRYQSGDRIVDGKVMADVLMLVKMVRRDGLESNRNRGRSSGSTVAEHPKYREE